MEKEKLNVKDKILLHLEKEERNMAWLARKTDIPYGSLYSILVHRIMVLTDDHLNKINETMETDFIND